MSLSPEVVFARLMSRARLRHLQLLSSIGELESLQRAADAVGMSQPGATHALAELESILEVALFERHSRGMRATPVGQALMPSIRSVLRQLQACSETLVSMKVGAVGTVRVAAIGAALSGLLAPLMPTFSEAHPDIVVDVLNVAADDLLGLLEAKSVEVLGCRRPAHLPPGYEFIPLLTDRYSIVCRPTHPLARKKRLTIAELASQTWLMPPPTGIAARDFDRLCAALDFVPSVCWVSGRSVLLMLAMIQHRDLLTLIPRNAVLQMIDAKLVVELRTPLPLPPALPPIGIVVATDRAGLGPPVRHFIEHAIRLQEPCLAAPAA